MFKILVMILFLLPICVQAGTVYKSVGADGQIIYSDHPPTNGKVDKTLNFSDLPATPISGSATSARNKLDKNAKSNSLAGQKMPDATQPTLFMAQWCGYCKQAKNYLNEKHIRYTAYDIDTDEGMRMMNASGGGKGIPVLLWKGQKVSGFSKDAYDVVFKNYPY